MSTRITDEEIIIIQTVDRYKYNKTQQIKNTGSFKITHLKY